MGYDRRSVNRKLWSYENEVDVSLRDGLFSEVTGVTPIYDSPSEHHEYTGNGEETRSLSGEYIISLYEVVARLHGVKIVPQIDIIMSTIIETLASSAGSFPIQQACSKVVPAIARYGIDPTAPEERRRHIIHSLQASFRFSPRISRKPNFRVCSLLEGPCGM
ncbi:hypothetical protein SLA2020_024930 [Shorea laevis]